MTSRRVATALLTAYSAVLVLSAFPPEARPRFLDVPSEVARIALRSLGIRAGVAVFETGRDDPRIVIRQDCIRLRGREANGRMIVLAPQDDHCVTEGVRVIVPWMEGALRTLVLRSPPGLAEPLIGDWVCHGPHWDAYDLREVELVWTQPWLDLVDGHEGIANAALVVWRCDPPGFVRRVLRPTDADLSSLEKG